MRVIQGYVKEINRPVAPLYKAGQFTASEFNVSPHSQLTILASVKTELLAELIPNANDPVYIVSRKELEKLIGLEIDKILTME